MRATIALSLICLTACSGGDAQQRVDLDQKPEFASAPMESPETKGALWQSGDGGASITFGLATRPPLFTVACQDGQVLLTRNSPADPQASAIMPLIGNDRIERVEVDAVKSGDGYVWQGTFLADDARLDVFGGSRGVEVTVPGAGTIDLAASPEPAALITRCRQNLQQPRPQQQSGQVAPQPAE